MSGAPRVKENTFFGQAGVWAFFIPLSKKTLDLMGKGVGEAREGQQPHFYFHTGMALVYKRKIVFMNIT